MSKTSKQVKRLESILAGRDINKADFCREINISPQAYNNWRTRGIPGNKIFVAADILQCRSEWLALGEEPMQQANLSNIETGPDIKGTVPLISWVTAGEFKEAIDNFHPGDAEDWLPRLARGGPNTYALRVRGDSMTAAFAKSYPDGCIIYVDPDQCSPTSGQRVIAKVVVDNEVTFKEYVEEGGNKYLKPLNPTHLPITRKFSILGIVIGKWEDE